MFAIDSDNMFHDFYKLSLRYKTVKAAARGSLELPGRGIVGALKSGEQAAFSGFFSNEKRQVHHKKLRANRNELERRASNF